jgi:hypothetical protein
MNTSFTRPKIFSVLFFSAIISPLQVNALSTNERPIIFDPIYSVNVTNFSDKFDHLSSEQNKICGFYDNSEVIVFASTSFDNDLYYAVMPMIKNPEGDIFGSIIKITKNTCSMVDSTWSITGRDPESPIIKYSSESILPGYSENQVCSNGKCYYFFKNTSEKIIIRSLMDDSFRVLSQVLGGTSEAVKMICSQNESDEQFNFPLIYEKKKSICPP